jgi:2-iminobutanoate/2-iminopropanoate deaminase
VYNEFFDQGQEPACATVLVDWIPGGSHVEVTCIATTDLSKRKTVRPTQLKITGPVNASPAVWAGDTLYLSGLVGSQPGDGAIVKGLEEQVHQLARNHTAVLDAAGLTLADIVSGCVYLSDMTDYQSMNAIYRQYFSRGPGVRTCLMPTAQSDKDEARVNASFIAARTRPAAAN